MGYLIIIPMIALAGALYLYVIAPYLTGKYISLVIDDESEDSPTLIPRLLKAFMPRRCVLTSVSLPIPGREGEELSYGTVAVNRAGIFIISRICGGGLVENHPQNAKWRFMSCGSIKEFPNPFKEQDAPRRLLAMYAGAAGVKNVRVHTLVIYTDPDLRFANPPSKGIMHVSETYKRMKRMAAKGNLDYKSIRAITNALRDANDGIISPIGRELVR